VPVDARPPAVRRYLKVAPGARVHVAVNARGPVQAFEKIAPEIPVFRITARGS